MGRLTDQQKERAKLKAREKRANSRKIKKTDVQCRLCNLHISGQGMPIHLKNIHDVEFKQYVTDNLPDFEHLGWSLCAVCRSLVKGTTCSTKCLGEHFKVIYKGRKSWNEGLTKETSDIIANSAIKSAKSRTNNPKLMGKNNSATRPEVRAKISKDRIDRGLAKGKNNGMYGKTHTAEAIKKIFENRSSTKPELQVEQILTDLNLPHVSQWFLNDGDKTYAYDFYVKSLNLIIEVDGDYWHGGPGAKIHWFGVESTKQKDLLKDKIAINQGYNIIRIWESELKADPQIFINKLQTRST